MDLKTMLGDAYKEGITIEEIEAALADKNLVDPETLPKSVPKDVFDKTASELAKAKKELKALQEQSMTAEEKLQAELEKAASVQSTYAKELAKLRAEEVFVKAGLTEKDYSSILDTVVSEDEEATKNRAKKLVDLIAAQKAVLEKTLKAELLKGTPQPPPGQGGTVVTKETFDKMTTLEQIEFKNKNPNWKELINWKE